MSKHCHQIIVATAVTTRVCGVEPCLIYIPSYLRTHCSPSGRSKGSYSTASCCTACCCFGPITFPSAMACALSAYKEGEYSVAISSTSTMPAHIEYRGYKCSLWLHVYTDTHTYRLPLFHLLETFSGWHKLFLQLGSAEFIYVQTHGELDVLSYVGVRQGGETISYNRQQF